MQHMDWRTGRSTPGRATLTARHLQTDGSGGSLATLLTMQRGSLQIDGRLAVIVGSGALAMAARQGEGTFWLINIAVHLKRGRRGGLKPATLEKLEAMAPAAVLRETTSGR